MTPIGARARRPAECGVSGHCRWRRTARRRARVQRGDEAIAAPRYRTIAGAIGGAVVGNEIEKKQVPGSRYRITVRLDSGSSLIVEDTRDVNLRVGDRVRVENDRIHRI